MNVTAVDPTLQTNLRIYPTPDDDTVPLTASLNPFPGLPQEFNGVVTDLNDDGEFSVYNRFGTVDIVIDVIGYYADHTHDDRYYTEEEVDAAIAAASTVVYESAVGDTAGVTTATTLLTGVLEAPADGLVVAEAVVTAAPDGGATAVTCSLSTDAAIDTDTAQSTGAAGDTDELSVMRGIEVAEGDTLTVNLVCESTGATSTFTNPQLALTFSPTPPAPPVT